MVPVFFWGVGGKVASVKFFLLGFSSERIEGSTGDENCDAALVAFRKGLPGYIVSLAGHGAWSH